MERLDPDRTSFVELNVFAWRLGYRKPPVHYWFKHPKCLVFLPITNDEQATKMIDLLPKSRMIQIYYIGGGERQVKLAEQEDKDPAFIENIPHIHFIPEIVLNPMKAYEGSKSNHLWIARAAGRMNSSNADET